MKLKSYFAGTVEAAMALAREELGPEALLVHSKKATPETRHIGLYEVVFALDESEQPSAPEPPRPAFSQVFSSERDSAIQKLSAELAALKQKIEGIATPAIAPGLPAPAAPVMQSVVRVRRPMDALFEKLKAREVDEEMAAEIAREAAAAGGNDEAIRAVLDRCIKVDATLGAANSSRKVVALAGPPGAGKTTTLVKLATRYGLSARRSMHFITTDVFRVGAAEQLRLYASIIGVGFQAVETPLALVQALEEQRRKDLVFIDTPGWVTRDLPEIRELAACIAEDPEIDVHLVLPASNRACDIGRMTERYSIFRPSKLIVTRLDETDRYGMLLNQTRATCKPVSFLSAGEQIPEDLEPATADRIRDMLLGAAEESN